MQFKDGRADQSSLNNVANIPQELNISVGNNQIASSSASESSDVGIENDVSEMSPTRKACGVKEKAKSYVVGPQGDTIVREATSYKDDSFGTAPSIS